MKKTDITPDTALVRVFQLLAEQLRDFPPDKMFEVIVCGGVAAKLHLDTDARTTTDIDAELKPTVVGINFDALQAVEANQKGEQILYHWDQNFNTTLALMEEDYVERAWLVPQLSFGNVVAKVLDPHDLIISKVARMAEPDQWDIRALTRAGLIDPAYLKELLNRAMATNPVSVSRLTGNVEHAMKIVKTSHPKSSSFPLQ